VPADSAVWCSLCSAIYTVFGEIDCREGILVAVERLQYRDLAEGIDVAQKHYLKMLQRLQKKREFQIFVHPVPPVMDITRPTCLEWNKRMEAKLHAVPSIAWLDFATGLMTADGKLQKQYELDGIHLHPAYIPLLEAALGSDVLGVDD
jgi:lysophospholipase L1-like esterase